MGNDQLALLILQHNFSSLKVVAEFDPDNGMYYATLSVRDGTPVGDMLLFRTRSVFNLDTEAISEMCMFAGQAMKLDLSATAGAKEATRATVSALPTGEESGRPVPTSGQ